MALNGRSSNVRILIADDHEVIRRGLRHLIEQHEGWRVCGEAGSGREAVELAATLAPNLIVMDLNMPELNGTEATRRIKASAPSTEVLILSMFDSYHCIDRAIEAGARGYFVKTESTSQIAVAVEALLEHKCYFSPSVSKLLLEIFLKHQKHAGEEASGALSNLTSREREVVQLLSEGDSNKSVAKKLNIALKTVETHRQAIMGKLNVRSLAGVVRFAVRNQIIVP